MKPAEMALQNVWQAMLVRRIWKARDRPSPGFRDYFVPLLSLIST